jgi:hypothetical protein
VKKFVVITSIYSPTEAVRRFAEQADWQTIVVADRKTPEPWACEGVRFVSVAEQESIGFRIAPLLPWNHYARKMLGYLIAIREGAELIVDSDDDNIPGSRWAFPAFSGDYRLSPAELGFVNVYRSFTDQLIWPRGFPLERVRDPAAKIPEEQLLKSPVRVGVWQGLVDGDPDVDAVYRMIVGADCRFEKRDPIVLNRGTVSPFNSQNTVFTRAMFPLLFLPATVSFRFTDILRGLAAQPIMWAVDHFLGVAASDVIQRRNPHDLLQDFAQEVPCFLEAANVVRIVGAAVVPGDAVHENLGRAYRALREADLVSGPDSDLLDAWIEDLQALEASGTRESP